MAFNYSPKISSNGLVSCLDNQNNSLANDLVGKTSITTWTQGANTFPESYSPRLSCRNASAGYQTSNFGTGCTMLIWNKRTGETTGTWNRIMGWDDGGPGYRTIWFGYYSNQTWRIHSSLPTWTDASTPVWWDVSPYFSDAGISSPSLNQYYLLGFTYDVTTQIQRVYINGVQAGSGTRPGHAGMNRTSNNNYSIQLDSIKLSSANNQSDVYWMWNRPLSGNEVKEVFNNTKQRYGY